VIAALIGLIGVLVGVFLSQMFTMAHESRAKRLDALVSIIAASGRMIGAYERLFELFEGGTSPPLHEDRVVQVTTERLSAHTQWREARARLEILLADDARLHAIVDDFEVIRADATRWARAYFQTGEAFNFADYAEIQRKSWEEMKAARQNLILAARHRAASDSRWLMRLPVRIRQVQQ
jgi:hypothetical protein